MRKYIVRLICAFVELDEKRVSLLIENIRPHYGMRVFKFMY